MKTEPDEANDTGQARDESGCGTNSDAGNGSRAAVANDNNRNKEASGISARSDPTGVATNTPFRDESSDNSVRSVAVSSSGPQQQHQASACQTESSRLGQRGSARGKFGSDFWKELTDKAVRTESRNISQQTEARIKTESTENQAAPSEQPPGEKTSSSTAGRTTPSSSSLRTEAVGRNTKESNVDEEPAEGNLEPEVITLDDDDDDEEQEIRATVDPSTAVKNESSMETSNMPPPGGESRELNAAEKSAEKANPEPEIITGVAVDDGEEEETRAVTETTNTVKKESQVETSNIPPSDGDSEEQSTDNEVTIVTFKKPEPEVITLDDDEDDEEGIDSAAVAANCPVKMPREGEDEEGATDVARGGSTVISQGQESTSGREPASSMKPASGKESVKSVTKGTITITYETSFTLEKPQRIPLPRTVNQNGNVIPMDDVVNSTHTLASIVSSITGGIPIVIENPILPPKVAKREREAEIIEAPEQTRTEDRPDMEQSEQPNTSSSETSATSKPAAGDRGEGSIENRDSKQKRKRAASVPNEFAPASGAMPQESFGSEMDSSESAIDSRHDNGPVRRDAASANASTRNLLQRKRLLVPYELSDGEDSTDDSEPVVEQFNDNGPERDKDTISTNESTCTLPKRKRLYVFFKEDDSMDEDAPLAEWRSNRRKKLRSSFKKSTSESSRARQKEQASSPSQDIEPDAESSPESDEEKELKCTYEGCAFKAPTKHMKRHIDVAHLKLKRFECDQCEFASYYRHQMKRHVWSNHAPHEKPHVCNVCDKRFVTKQMLTNHVDGVHLELKEFACDRCEFKSAKRCNLRAHVDAVHLGLKKFACSECEFRTGKKSELQVHVDVAHLDLKRYACPECSFKSARKSVLRQHVKGVHLKQKEHKCADCSYRSLWKKDLRKHVNAVHLKLKEFKCGICQYETAWEWLLKKHLLTDHGQKE